MQLSSNGQLLQRSLRKLSAIKLGATLTLEDINADEMHAMTLIEHERDKFEEERREADGKR